MRLIPAVLIPVVALVACKPTGEVPADAQKIETPQQEQTMRNTAAPDFKVVPLQGYFVRNTVVADQDTQHVLISTREEFDQYFGIAKTMTNEITAVDFTSSNVIAIFTKPSDHKTEISIEQATVEDKILTLEYKRVTGEKQSFTSRALILFTIPKDIKLD